MKREITEAEAREAFGRLVDEVCEQNGEYIITRGNEPRAAIISLEQYDQLTKERDRDFEVFDRIWARMPEISEEDADRLVETAIREVRAQKRGK
jgi:prevent-host-death family protein